MKSLSAKTFQCGVTVQGLTTLSGTVYLTALTNTATWDYVVVGTTAQGQLYTRTYAQLMSDITSGIGLSGYVPTSRTLTINGVSYDLTANRSWTITTPYVSKLQHTVKAGVAINKGQAVYVTSADGTNMIVGLASNASEATSSKTMGLLDATVSTNGFANVVTEGLLDGLDTSTAGAAGDPVWLGTGGNLIYGLTNKPYAPAHLVFIGIVTRKNANNGEIFVKVQNGFELKEIHDVDLITTAPINGHLLGYNGTLWVNKTIAGWLGYTPANASGTTNYISKFTGSTTLGNSQIFDNGTNVGIGTTSPIYKLHVSNNANGFISRFTGGASSDVNIGIFGYTGAFGSIGTESNHPLNIFTSGTDRMTISTSGNVGIGTTSPAYKLDVSGIINTTSSPGSYGAIIRIRDTVTAGTESFGGVHFTSSPGTDYTIGKWTTAAGAGLLQIRDQAGNQFVTINSSGNVGIGTTGPAYKLDVNVASNSDALRIQQAGAARFILNGDGVMLWGGGSANAGYLSWDTAIAIVGGQSGTALALYAGASEKVRITTGGNVGIGITNPSDPLHIATSGGDKFIRIENSNSYTGLWLNDGGTNSGWLVLSGYTDTPSPGDFAIREYGVQTSLTIKQTSGNVGIGTTNPTGKLTISQNNSGGVAALTFTEDESTIQGPSANTKILMGGNLSLNAASTWIAGTNGSERMRITSDGNVGIGTTSPAYKLDVKGNLSVATMPTTNTVMAAFMNGATEGIEFGHTGSNGVYGITNANYIGSSYFVSGSFRSLAFVTSNAAQMVITTTGNVGIGTISPTTKLEVVPSVSNSSIRTGGLEMQSYAVNNSWYAENLYFNGASWRLRDTGFATQMYMLDGTIDFNRVATGAAGSAATLLTTMRLAANGNVGIGTTTPATLLDVNGVITATGGNSTNWNTAYGWGNHASASYVPQARTLTINGTSYDLSANRSWTIATTTPGGSDTQVQYNSSGTLAGASALIYNSTTNRVGINQASPGYDLDVNGQVRVQDKLRIGTGNGVVHMSSTATINASATTIVWAQTVSVGVCAFIEYYILNNNSLTDQRAGTIIVTWNQSGTPTIAHTETTTPDIGSTTAINFTSSLVGSDARINAVNSSANPYTMVMSYKYF